MLFFIALVVVLFYIIIRLISGSTERSSKEAENEKFRQTWNNSQAAINERVNHNLSEFQNNFDNCFPKAVTDTLAKYIFIDFETTGLPYDFKMPAEDLLHEYPYCVQAACLVFNENAEIIDQYCSIVCTPELAEFHPAATRIHGITRERCNSEGKPISDFFEFFKVHVYPGVNLIAHNIQFDHFILKLEAKRNSVKLPPVNKFCTMKSTKEDVNIWYGNKLKNPNLKELVCYSFFEGKNVDLNLSQHDALVDVKLCALSFFKLKLNELCISNVT